jgi:hypothetical protein
MRLFEFADAKASLELWKLVSDSVWKAISVQAQEQERIAQQDQQKQKKMPKSSQPRKTAPKLAKPSKPKVVAPQASKTKQSSQQQIARDKERKNTPRSKLQTTSVPKSSVASVGAQNTLQARSVPTLHDPNSVANTERKLYPLANDDVVKRLTS